MKEKKISFVSLGCFRNRYDSEVVAAQINAGKNILIEPEEISYKKKCDILVVNTCGFIDPAKIESIQAIREAISWKKSKKVKKIYVFGCLVERFEAQLRKHFPQVDKWWGKQDFSHIYQKRARQPNPVDFLKICEGCINQCSYCAIPIIKGPLKSRPAAEILKEVEDLEKSGVKELNIIGQDITSWAKDLKGKKDLTFLLKKILKKTKKIKWIRLIYTHPRHLSNELIELVAREERICNYIDLPIQHINKRILKLMNRKITPLKIISLIKKIRKKIPNCTLRTSLIVGFPTESEAEFQELLNFVGKVKFERLGVFSYSRQEGTTAAGLSGQVHPMTKKRRYRQIMEAQQKISRKNLQKFKGKKIPVLITAKRKDFCLGRSQFDAPEVDGLVFIKKNNLKVGQFYRAKVIDSLEYDLVAC